MGRMKEDGRRYKEGRGRRGGGMKWVVRLEGE